MCCQHDLRNHSNTNNIDASRTVLICHEAKANRCDACQNVWRYSKQLCGLVGVSHASDDGRQKDRNAVQRHEISKGHDTIDPDLPVAECILNELRVELVRECRVVISETAYNFRSLGFREEFGGVRVVVEIYVRNSGWL
jgi:hypothetical protein